MKYMVSNLIVGFMVFYFCSSPNEMVKGSCPKTVDKPCKWKYNKAPEISYYEIDKVWYWYLVVCVRMKVDTFV